MSRYVLALDQGTTSSRSILFDHSGRAIAQINREFTQYYPQPGWVEHDAEEIWQTQIESAHACLKQASVSPDQIAAIGITNQRETTVVWDRVTGKPLHRAIVWQCRRTAERCDRLRAEGWADTFRAKTGLVLDAYFSGTKLQWLLDEVEGLRDRAERGEVCFGTIDSWLAYRLSGDKLHVTDYSNASRTLLFNIHTLEWDTEILDKLAIPRSLLPKVCSSSEVYGESDPTLFGQAIPIAGIAGDQQAALFGQACFQPGMAKNTYGTGCFLLMNAGDRCPSSEHGLLSTIAWGLNGRVTYALEGSVFIAGAAVQWLRDGLELFQSAAETEALAASLTSNDGVYLVPAFVGLGAPYWDMEARGSLVGLTRGSGKAHFARAALEAMAYQTRDVVTAMAQDAGQALTSLRVDGGASSNNWLMQFQADLLGVPVDRPSVPETTALGAAYLAGLAVGFWDGLADIEKNRQIDRTFSPERSRPAADQLYEGWLRAIAQVRHHTSK